MFALVLSQVDQLRRFGDRADRCFDDGLRIRNESDHRTIMVRVDMPIENNRASDRSYCLGDLFDRFGLAALTKVWYTLNEHCRFSIANCRLQLLQGLIVSRKEKIGNRQLAIGNQQCLSIASSMNARLPGKGSKGFCIFSTA
jgi:hypothetical protein